MSPQAATPNTPADDKKPEELSTLAKLVDRLENTDEDDRTSPENQIVRAAVLERERAAVLKKIDSNRKYLRLMGDNEELTDEEADFLDTFYPDKERGERRSDDDVESTRKLREEVRKMGKGKK